MIHVVTPYSVSKNLGAAYNATIRLYPENSWICLLDHDVMFLTPDAIGHLEKYAASFPDTGIFTCYTNRLHPDSKGQLLGPISEDSDIRNHIRIAERQKSKLYQVGEINHPIGGFLMMINKATWNEVKFSENKKCLGVDNDFSDRVLRSGRKILRCEGIVVWHSYRLMNGWKNKDHLR